MSVLQTCAAGAMLAVVAVGAAGAPTDMPIIATFSQPVPDAPEGCPAPCEYLVNSYVQWLGGGGARTVVIPYNASAAEVDAVLNQVNGLFFAGGASVLSDGARHAVARAKQFADDGDHFPVWGTCLGFEWLLDAVGTKQGEPSIMDTGFKAEDIQLPLAPLKGMAQSRLFGALLPNSVEWLTGHAVTQNNHDLAMTPATFEAHPTLGRTLLPTSTGMDQRGVKFISSFEAREMPWYGTQFHPEKAVYEFGLGPNGKPHLHTNHEAQTVRAMQEMAMFFVDEARKSHHHFATPAAEKAALATTVNAPRSGVLDPIFEGVLFYHNGSPVQLKAGLKPIALPKHRPQALPQQPTVTVASRILV